MNVVTENANRIYDYIKEHPGCNRTQIEMALDILNTEFVEARVILRGKVISKQVKGELQHRFYLAEDE